MTTKADVMTQRPARRHPGKERALIALAQAKSYAEAAKEAGVVYRTITRWMNQDPTFRLELDDLRRRVVRQTEASLASASVAAVGTLEAQLAHRDPWLAQKAALGLLEHSRKARELELGELEARVATALERAQKRGLLK